MDPLVLAPWRFLLLLKDVRREGLEAAELEEVVEAVLGESITEGA